MVQLVQSMSPVCVRSTRLCGPNPARWPLRATSVGFSGKLSRDARQSRTARCITTAGSMMPKELVLEEVQRTVGMVLAVPPPVVQPSAKLASLGADESRIMELFIALIQRFHMFIPQVVYVHPEDDCAPSLQDKYTAIVGNGTVQELVDLIAAE